MAPFAKSRRFRRLAARTFGTVGVALILAGGSLAYATKAIFDSKAFADRAAESLADPRVASFVATKVTDALIAEARDLTPFRPILIATTDGLVSSAPFRAVMRRSVRESHALALTEGGQNILLTVSDAGVILKSALAPRPEIADKLPDKALAVIAAVEDAPFGQVLPQLLRLGQRMAVRALLALALGILLLGLGVMLSADRRVALSRLGIALTAASVLVFVLVWLGGPVIELLVSDPAGGAALAGVWDAFTAGLRARSLALAVIGLVLAAAATSLVQTLDFNAATRKVSAAFWGPLARGRSRLARAAAAILLGGLAIMEPQAAAQLLVLVAGGIMLFIGLTELFGLALPAFDAGDSVAEQPTPKHRRGALRIAMASVAVLAVLVTAATVLVRSPAPAGAARPTDACNGSRELCDRPLDQVVFPGTHNSMSAAEFRGWMFANQEMGPLTQLRDGVRAFLIDVYPGIAVGERVKTDIDDGEIVREKYEGILGREGFDAAVRIRNRLLTEEDGDHALYLCHGLCELGALPLVPLLASMREFLVLNPHEVLIIIFEDAVAPAEIETAFRESRLIDFVYRRHPGPPWLTLREMIATDQRVLVLAEKDGRGVPWYHQAFEVFQETPYSFHDPSEFSCAANRGGTAGPLFLMNHWISTAPSSLPSDAEIVNAYDVLLARAEECRRDRGLIPNVVAVDFYRTGDLLPVAQTLNEW
jgi:hypothetical protein